MSQDHGGWLEKLLLPDTATTHMEVDILEEAPGTVQAEFGPDE
jgi:hypothetical protein